MSSYVGARIRIETREGKYEGILHSIDPVTKLISIKQAIALPSGQKYLGLLNFYGQEINELTVVAENELSPVSNIGHEPNVSQITQARSYDDPENPEIFDDYQYDNQQMNSYAADWGIDPAPLPYSEEVVIPQESEENRPEIHPQDTSHQQAVCERMQDLSLDNNSPLHQPEQSSSPTKPIDTTTGGNQRNYILINQHDGVFDQAIADMEQQNAIGLVLKGSRLGRKGKLSLVLVLCDEQVYMFDVLAIPSLFTRKFIDILQTVDITKVIHDCRFVSDLLYHHYGIQLNSVFDTQVGDILLKRRQYMGDFPRNVSGTTECILEYLEISIHDIAMHLENTQRIEEDESSWLQRPLSNVNIRCALLDTVYLLRLREAIIEQLMAEFTCAIDIYLAVERDRLEVDTKKIQSRASYVPRELISDLHRMVAQIGMSNTRVKPKELSYPPHPSAVSSQDRGQSPKGPSCRGTEMQERSQNVPWGFQKTPPRMSAKSSQHEPPRPPLMIGRTQTQEEEEDDNEDVLSVSSEDSDEAFADNTEKELWQQRYSQNIKPVSLREALTAKEENDDNVPRYIGATGSIHEHQRAGYQQSKKSTIEHAVPSRTIPNSTSVPGPEGNSGTEDGLKFRKGSSRAVDMAQCMTDHSYSQQPGSVGPLKLTDLRLHDTSQRQSSAVPKKLCNMQHPEVIQRHPSGEQNMVSGQASYADALSGKKKEEELKIKAKRTLTAIGKALAAGENFGEDNGDEDKDSGDSRVDPSNGFDGYSSYGQGYSGFNGRNKLSSENTSADQGPARTIGRGRASLINHRSQVLNARQSQVQSRVGGGLGMRSPGRLRTVQVDFPTTEEMESAPESVPIAAGSSFLTQRAI